MNYGDAKGVELVTNEFNSNDLQMIAEKMVGSLLETGIFQAHPTVTISTVKNGTSEYIDTTNVMNSIQTTLIKSGKVRFVRLIAEMQQGVDELQCQNQSGRYKQDGNAKVGKMAAAKYTLEGELTSIVKQSDTTKDVFYKATLPSASWARSPMTSRARCSKAPRSDWSKAKVLMGATPSPPRPSRRSTSSRPAR